MSYTRCLSVDPVVVDLVAEVKQGDIGGVYPLEWIVVDMSLGDVLVDKHHLIIP